MKLNSALLLLLALMGLSAQAETVTAVGKTMFAVSHPNDAQWEVSDRLCVRPSRGDEICGTVIKVTERAAFVKPDRPPVGIFKGSKARTLASLPPEENLEEAVRGNSELAPVNLAAGFSVGAGFLLPLVDFQYAPSRIFAVGLMPGFAAASSELLVSVTLIGAYATGTFYLQKLFDGFYIQLGVGGFSLSASDSFTGTSQSSFIFSGFSAVGYRIRCSDHFNITISAQGQYFSEPNISLAAISFSGFKPAGTILFGYRF